MVLPDEESGSTAWDLTIDNANRPVWLKQAALLPDNDVTVEDALRLSFHDDEEAQLELQAPYRKEESDPGAAPGPGRVPFASVVSATQAAAGLKSSVHCA